MLCKHNTFCATDATGSPCEWARSRGGGGARLVAEHALRTQCKHVQTQYLLRNGRDGLRVSGTSSRGGGGARLVAEHAVQTQYLLRNERDRSPSEWHELARWRWRWRASRRRTCCARTVVLSTRWDSAR